MNKSNIIIFVLVVSLAFALFCLFKTKNTQAYKKCDDRNAFVSSDISCGEDPTSDTLVLKELTNTLVSKFIQNKSAKRISIFYRDLSNRQWFGINENDPFAPGSLLKLPLAIAYYKLSELDPTVMKEEYKYEQSYSDGSLYNGQTIKPDIRLMPGTTYTVAELIERMIMYSDNEAVPVLSSSINRDFYNKVYLDLGVYVPTTNTIEKDFVSVKTYASILRSLYNASYLNRESSNNLLSIMSKSSFKSGIASGVPETVLVSNKFGERVWNESAITELHDCGIVYTHRDPYILCVMTEGVDLNKLKKVISEISNTIYENR